METSKGTKARTPAAGGGADEESLGYLVRDTHKHFARLLQTRLEGEGIGLGQWYFLRVLWDGDGLTQAELGNRAGTMSPTTVSVLNGLEAQGLVERRRHPTDRRKFNVFLTKRGRQLKRTLLPRAMGVNAVAVEAIAPEDLERAFAVLKRVRANLIRALAADAETPQADVPVTAD
ncbi:MarR family winged helix-turn-helix transcriptional regulator [Azospirillum sp. ST 5-10]|uniref:MarR family winged helix-turn-helix transcriptional regulator n=1 Tax=unclassified Azospirillum TaxID=2630922 RepID=UPI003F4A3633